MSPDSDAFFEYHSGVGIACKRITLRESVWEIPYGVRFARIPQD